MADLNEFESAEQAPVATEEDPAAAFLAREQDQLAELEGDISGADNSQPPPDDGFDPFGGEAASGQSNDDLFGGGAQEPQNSREAGDILDNFDDQSAPPAQDNFLDDLSGSGDQQNYDAQSFDQQNDLSNGPMDSYSAISQVDKIRAEPEKIKIWREEQAKRLEVKDIDEAKKQEEWKVQAKKELDDWYKHNAEQLSKTKENNRAAEAAFVKERDDKSSGHDWEKICHLCEFNPKNSKNTKDISRLRSILLQLKQTGLEREVA